MLPDENGQAPLAQHRRQPISEKKQVTCQQPDGNGIAGSLKRSHPGSLGQGVLAAVQHAHGLVAAAVGVLMANSEHLARQFLPSHSKTEPIKGILTSAYLFERSA